MLTVAIKKKLPDFTLDVNFKLGAEILVLFGASGCGKTTILRSIAGLTEPDEGTISFKDQIFFSSHVRQNIPSRRRHVGYMFQDYALFPHLNVEKNILYGVKQFDTKTQELYEKLLSLLKIKHLCRRAIRQLSGGEKQRIALARSLMTNPQVLLLDEPMSALDQKTRLELQKELKKIQGLWKIPFILVTHDLEEAKSLGSRILYITQGKEIRQCCEIKG